MRKHLKLCILLSLFLAIFSVAFADTVIIGTGTTTTATFPIHGLWNYSYSQQIYTQSQINYTGEIEKVRFFYVSGTITNCKDWTIYMGHTDKTSFDTGTDWISPSELTEVFSGDVSSFLPATNNWMEIPLDTVFDYNNSNNLVIAVKENTSGYASMSWGGFTSGTDTGIYYSEDPNPINLNNLPTAKGRSATINRLQLVFPSTNPPLAPTLVAPANNAVNQDMPILSWQATSGGGDPSTYDLYLGTDPNPPLFAEDLNQASYQFTVYDYETDYHWKVVAKNNIGSSPESEIWKFTTRLDPNRPLPYFQDFDSGTSLAAIEWGGDMYISSTHGADGTNGLYKNMYSYTNTTNVVSCPIGPMLPNSELKFDYRFVEYSNYPNNPKVLVAGDEILVQISTDGGITYTTIHTIDHTNHTNTNQFTTATVNLSAYDSGNVKFKLVTNWGGGDYYIDIDNFMVREVPEYPILSINPDALDFGTVFYNATSEIKNVIVSNSGVGVLHLEDTDVEITGTNADLFSFDDTVFPFALTTGESAPIPVSLVGTIEGDVSANLEITYDGNTETVALSANVLPQGTAIIGDGTLTQRQPFSGTWGYERSAAIYTLAEIGNPGMIESIGWNASSSRTNSYPYKIYLGVTADTQVTAQTFDNLIQDMTLVHEGDYVFDSPDWHTFTLSDPFAFVGGNLIVAVETNYGGSGGGSTPNFYYTTATNAHMFWYADGSEPATSSTINSNRPNLMLSLGELSGPPELSVSPASINFGDAVYGATMGPRNISLTNIGGGSLTIEASDVSLVGSPQFDYDDSIFPLVIDSAETMDIPVTLTGTIEGPATATITISFGGDNFEVELSANVLPDGLVMIGDGTVKNDMPVNAYWGYSYAQMLYRADEIQTQGRQIEKVAYHWNGFNDGGNSNQWTIYMGHTDKEAFDSTSDWIDINELTEVFQGDVAISAQEMWVEIDLQMPFVYNGTDNLVIAVHETRPGNDGYSAFFYNTPSTTGRSLRCQSDSANPNPATPPTGTLTPAYPNIRMYFADVPEDAILSITPDSWDAGEIIINTQASEPFTVRNIGGGTLVVNDITVSGDYFTLAAPFTGASLETGEGAPFTVNFNPLAAGDYQGSITIDTSVGVENIEIEGSCFDPTIRELPYTENFDSMTTPTMPMGWTVLNPDNPSVTWQTYSTNSYSSPNCVRIGYTPSAGGPLNDWFITPPVEMEAGKEYRVSFYYRASSFYGDENLALYFGSEPTETGMTELLWSDEGFNRDSYALVEEVVSPTADGSYFFGWYGYSEPYEYGICVDDVTIIELSPTPVFVVEPSSHDFGELKINTTSSKNIKVTNMGGGELVITEIEISGDDAFALGTLPTLPAILERDEFINFDAIFAPTAAGDHNATITITDNQNTRYTINAGSLRSGNSRSRDDHTVTLTGSCFDPTIYDFPYLEDFGTTTADWPPTEWTQRNGLYPNASGTTSQWVRGNWLNGASGNNAAKINIYGTVRNGWLITRPINIQSENFELKFDLGLTKWNNPDPINDLEGQPDDRFMVIVSDSPDMANPSILREWNNDDSELVFNHIPHTGIPVSIPLTGITGTKYFAFYAESTISNGDNDLFVDNVLIREIPDNPIFVINPESHDFDDIMVNTSASQVFTIINNGGGALIIDSIEIDGDDAFSLENLPELPTTLGAGDTATFGAVFAPSAGGDYSAIITVIDNLNTRYSVNAGPKRSRNTGSRAANTVTLTGSCFDPTIRTFPFFEGFEDGNTHNSTTISQWEQIIGSGTKQWTANNTFTDRNRTPRTGSWNAFLSWGGESTLIRPIMLEANQEYKLTFYARQDNANSTLANVKAAFGAGNTLDDLTETIIEQTGVVDGDYQEFSGVFSTETGGIYFIGITGWIDSSPWYLILDDITIDYNYIVTPNDHADVGGDTTASVTGDGFVGAIEVPMAPENLTPIPNPSFVVINHQVWQLIGTGEINLRFDNNGTEDIWFSHVVGGAWFAQEIPAGGHINVSVDLDAKDASLEFALGTGGNPTLPVELSYFNAVFMLNENSVKLSWKTESETQMLGYQIYRSMNTELANAILITPVIVTASNSSTGDSYSYLDKEVESGTYYYWLEAVSYNSSDYYGYQTVVIDIPSAPELPEISSMGNAYPNPFKNATNIDIAIKGGETGSFTIYNMLGQAVYREKLSEGNVTIQWHGKDNNGNRCGSGVYFYKLITPTKSQTKKMVIMK